MTEFSFATYWWSFVGVTLIAFVHLFARHAAFLQRPDNPWIAASAGVAIGYAFMELFPALAKAKALATAADQDTLFQFLTSHAYLISLVGFAVYLGIIILASNTRTIHLGKRFTFQSAPLIYRIELASLAGYNFLIGYLTSELETHLPAPVLLLGVAMAIHFAGLDRVLRDHFTEMYDRGAGVIFAVSVYFGWIAGVVFEIANATLALWYALLGGCLLVIATVYELPHIQTFRQYRAFLAGAALFSALVLIVEYWY